MTWYWKETAPQNEVFEDDYGNKCSQRESCFACYGTGVDYRQPCFTCGGKGWVPVTGTVVKDED